MRLLSTQTFELTLFVDAVPDYAILSHRWEEEELTFVDIVNDPISEPNSNARQKQGFAKIQGTCALAVRHGFDWVWIDSCCIDKSSSSELQEAINSMFAWYHNAQICYAYLSDVPDEEAGWNASFKESKWFTRGWTLQELLAPEAVEFYAKDWSPIGTKFSRFEELAQITGIAPEALFHQWFKIHRTFVAAQKMSWAAHRRVSRAEDEAYSLLGLFDVNIPMLYGEGRRRAFLRLQEAIFQMDADHSLFLFTHLQEGSLGQTLFPETVAQFCQGLDCAHCAHLMRTFPLNVPYSHLSPAYQIRDSNEDPYYVRFIRDGAIVRSPIIEVAETESDLFRARYSWPGKHGHMSGQIFRRIGFLVAALHIRVQGYDDRVLTIPLEQTDKGFQRSSDPLILVPANNFYAKRPVIKSVEVRQRILSLNEMNPSFEILALEL